MRVYVEQRGDGTYAWIVAVGETVTFSGLTRAHVLKALLARRAETTDA